MSKHRASRTPRIAATALAGAAALALTACGSDEGGGGDGAADGTLAVTASFYPMEFLAERIGGEHVDVTGLTEPGVEPHDLRLTARQTGELAEADVVLYIETIQPAVDDAIAQSGVEHIVEGLSLTGAAPAEDSEHTHEDEHAEDGHAHEDEHAEDGHAHEDEHAEDEHTHEDEHDGHHDGHDHGGADPHIWLDPLTYAVVADGVADTFAEADPDHADTYRANADTLVEELHTLDEEFEQGLADRTTDTFITNHAAFGYLAERYGLDEEAIAGLDPENEPSGARIQELHDLAESENVTTVFFETLASDATATVLADDLGLATDVLDPLEGITDASRGADYFEIMRANLTALRSALGAQS